MISTDMYYFAASYAIIIFGGFALINWLSNGIVGIFLRVKASRETYVLVKVHSRLRTYAVKGWIEGNDLCYMDAESKKNKQKTPKRINFLTPDVFYKFMGVWVVDVDEATNNVYNRGGQVLPGWDPIRWNNVLLRALMKPSPNEKKGALLLVVLIAVILCIILCIVIFFKIGQITTVLNNLNAALTSPTVPGMNV